MAKCRICGKKGLFLNVDFLGRCNACMVRELMKEPNHTTSKSQRSYEQEENHRRYTVVGVTFKNDDGTDRQKILKRIADGEPPFEDNLIIELKNYEFKKELAVGVYVNDIQIGNIAAKEVESIIAYLPKVEEKKISVYGGYEGKNYGAAVLLFLKDEYRKETV